MDVQGPGISIVAVAPYSIQQLLTRDDSVSALGQDRKKAEFFVGKFDLTAVANYSYIVEVDHQLIVFVDLSGCLIDPAKHRTNTRQEFPHRERLSYVVVGA